MVKSKVRCLLFLLLLVWFLMVSTCFQFVENVVKVSSAVNVLKEKLLTDKHYGDSTKLELLGFRHSLTLIGQMNSDGNGNSTSNLIYL